MRNNLSQQVEKILDEAESDRQTVIVQMDNPDRMADPVIEIIAEALRRRTLLLTARDLLPSGRGARGETPGREGALVTPDGALARGPLRLSELRREGLRAINSLLASEMGQKAIERARESQGLNFDPETIAFWPGSAAFLNLTADDLRKLPQAVPGISGIYPNRRIPPPQVVEHQRVAREVSEGRPHAWGIEKINALAVWGAHGVRGRGVTVGILDTGVDTTHSDLQGKLKEGGWAEFNVDGNPVVGSVPHDSGTHGTECAGTIVGGNKSGGWIGVAPEAQFAAALVIDGVVGGSECQVLAGIRWMLTQGVDVINLSIGKFIADPETPPVFSLAIFNCMRAGIPAVVAIGNEGAQTTDSPGNDLMAYSVGATDLNDNPTGFSGGRTQILRHTDIPDFPSRLLPFFYRKPEIAAPGVAIRTSVPRDAQGNDRWVFDSGTSLATAHVSGAVALLLSATTIRQYTQAAERTYAIQDALSGSVVELGESGHDQRFGWGRLDVLRAISFAHESGFKP